MLVQILFIVGGLIAIGLGLAVGLYALSALMEPPAQRVTVPVDDPVRPHGR